MSASAYPGLNRLFCRIKTGKDIPVGEQPTRQVRHRCRHNPGLIGGQESRCVRHIGKRRQAFEQGRRFLCSLQLLRGLTGGSGASSRAFLDRSTGG